MRWTVRLEATTTEGDVVSVEVGGWKKPITELTADEVGLSLEEGKELLAAVQRGVVRSQVEMYVAGARLCPVCLKRRPVCDQRTRKLQTVFGTVEVAAPRIRPCMCARSSGSREMRLSPLSQLLPSRATPELQRLQAELGARHSFREAARLFSALLPCSPPNHASVRNRLHEVAAELDADEDPVESEEPPEARERQGDPDVIVLIDGAHIRAVPGHQARHLDVTVGKVEVPGRRPRRFALAPRGAERPLKHLRAALAEQGWWPGMSVTVVSDGEAALPSLVEAATGEPVAQVLDWWHVSMRIRHVEQALRGIYALEPEHRIGFNIVAFRLGRLRHLLWKGYHDEARRELFNLRHLAGEAVFLNGERMRNSVQRFLSRCNELHSYLPNNETGLVDYSARNRAGQPVSTSRAESCVEEIAKAQFAICMRMWLSCCGRWRFARMDNTTFQAWLLAAEGLTASQRDEALGVLSGAPEAAASVAAVERGVDEERRCPHCHSPGAIKRGMARRLRRYQCKGGAPKSVGCVLSGRPRDRGRLTSAAPTPRGAHAAQSESSDILARWGNSAAEDAAARHQPDDLAPGADAGCVHTP